MEESTLFKIALVASLLGIISILFIVEKQDLSKSNISSAKSQLDSNVKIKGLVTSVKETPGLLILNVKDNTDEIKVIVFKEDEIKVNKDNIIEVEGKVIKYKNETEIQADLIRLF